MDKTKKGLEHVSCIIHTPLPVFIVYLLEDTLTFRSKLGALWSLKLFVTCDRSTMIKGSSYLSRSGRMSCCLQGIMTMGMEPTMSPHHPRLAERDSCHH